MGLQSNRGSGLPLSNTEVGKISLNPHWNSTVISVGTFTCPWIVCRKNKGRGKKLGRVTFPMCLGRACSFDCTPTLCWMLTVLLLCHNDPSLPCLTSSFFLSTHPIVFLFYLPVLTCMSVLLTTVYGLFSRFFQAKTGFLWKGQCHLLLLRPHSDGSCVFLLLLVVPLALLILCLVGPVCLSSITLSWPVTMPVGRLIDLREHTLPSQANCASE